MAALTTERNTVKKYDPRTIQYGWPVKGGVKIYKGALVALNAGFAAPGATATGRIAIGKAAQTVDNTSGADGAAVIEIEQGVFKWANDGGDACVPADRGATVYITDDQTISKTATGKSAAGKLYEIDADGGVWVATFLT
jgi:hypothetical protein